MASAQSEPESAILAGVVRDPDGTPVEGALVFEKGDQSFSTSGHRSAADGSFSIRVDPGCWTVSADAPEEREPPVASVEISFFDVEDLCTDVAAGATLHQNLTLPWAGFVRGVVTTATGQPARFARIEIGEEGVTTAANGTYRLAIEEGAHSVRIPLRPPNVSSSSSHSIVPSCDEAPDLPCARVLSRETTWLNLTLPPEILVTIMATNAQGAPLRNGSVTIGDESISLWFDLGADGNLTTKLPAGRYSVEVEDDGPNALSHDPCGGTMCLIVNDTPVELAVRLPANVDLTGRALTANGTPIARATVELYAGHATPEGTTFESSIDDARTDANGTFRFRAFEGNYRLALAARSDDDVLIADCADRGEHQVCERITLAGNTTRDLRLPALFPVQLRVTTPTGIPVDDASVELRGTYVIRGTTNATGNFTELAPMGSYSAHVSGGDPPHLDVTCEACVTVGNGSVHDILVEPAAAIEISFTGAPRDAQISALAIVHGQAFSIDTLFGRAGAILPAGAARVLAFAMTENDTYVGETSIVLVEGENSATIRWARASTLALGEGDGLRARFVATPTARYLVGWAGFFDAIETANATQDGETVALAARVTESLFLAELPADASADGWAIDAEMARGSVHVALDPPPTPTPIASPVATPSASPSPNPSPSPSSSPSPSPSPASNETPLAGWLVLGAFVVVAWARRHRDTP